MLFSFYLADDGECIWYTLRNQTLFSTPLMCFGRKLYVRYFMDASCFPITRGRKIIFLKDFKFAYIYNIIL